MPEWTLLLILLLLPLAVWSGYRVGLREQQKKSEEGRYSSGYFAGLNYLLNEQPDKAIDIFIEQLQVDNEVVETHLALGNLFRRRGEVDRAIRIHQNLIARPALPSATRKLALQELAYDYLTAGLYDRAETLYIELLSEPKQKQKALTNLLVVYQQLKDWPKAIKTAQQLASVSGKPESNRLVHFYCEIADNDFTKDDTKQAVEAIKQAIKASTYALRPNLLLAKSYIDSGAYKKALKTYKVLTSHHISYISEFLNEIKFCHTQLKTEAQFCKELESYLVQGSNVDVLVMFSELAQKYHSEQYTEQVIQDFIMSQPSIGGLEQLLIHYMSEANNEERGRLNKLHSFVVALIDENPRYRCKACGYKSQSLLWQCPSCREWGKSSPLEIGEEH